MVVVFHLNYCGCVDNLLTWADSFWRCCCCIMWSNWEPVSEPLRKLKSKSSPLSAALIFTLFIFHSNVLKVQITVLHTMCDVTAGCLRREKSWKLNPLLRPHSSLTCVIFFLPTSSFFFLKTGLYSLPVFTNAFAVDFIAWRPTSFISHSLKDTTSRLFHSNLIIFFFTNLLRFHFQCQIFF